MAALVAAFLALGFLAGCSSSGGGGNGDGGGGTEEPPTVVGTTYAFQYEGPGGVTIVDNVTLGTSEFIASSSQDFQYWGTVTHLSNGYLALAVTHSEREDIVPLSTSYGIELPQALLATFSPSSGGPAAWDFSPGIAEGGICPTNSTAALVNFVESPGASLTVGTEAIGTVTYTGTGTVVDFTDITAVQLIDGTGDASVPGGVLGMACNLGRFAMPDVADFTATPSGFMIGEKIGTGGGVILSLPQTTTPPSLSTGALYLGFSMRTVDTDTSSGLVDVVEPAWGRGTGAAIEAGGLTSFTDAIPAAGTGSAVTVGSWANGKAVMETVTDAGCTDGVCDFRYITAPLSGKHAVIGMVLGLAAPSLESTWQLVVLIEQ